MITAKRAVLGLVVVLGVVAVVGYAYVTGLGPLEEDPAEGLENPPETDTTYDMGGKGQVDLGEQKENLDTPPFAFEVESIENCGRTCRDVTVGLYNQMQEDAEDVTVHTWIYAGNSTDRDDVVWADRHEVGTLGGEEVHRSTDRVELSVQQANNVRDEDGLITIEATVESQEQDITFVSKEEVN